MHCPTYFFSITSKSMACGTFCPISHIPLEELRMAVVFRGEARTVYDAEHLVRWLREFTPKNPMTNEPVPAGRRIHEVLAPIRLPHMHDSDLERTARYLRRQGRLRLANQRWTLDCFGLCMCMIIWVSGFYGLLFVAECSVAALESKHADLACLIAPMLLFCVQMACVLAMCWMFPEIRAYAALCQAVCLTLACVLAIHAFSWALRLYATPEEVLRWVAEGLARNRWWVRFVVHPRMLGLVELVLEFQNQ